MPKNDQHVVFIAEDVIPKGCTAMTRKACALRGEVRTLSAQENGYCTFLMQRDWESEGVGLLWDQLKACDVNCETDDEGYF